ncbi:MAG: ribbon-helix-helix domain-containing protein [Candidatus Poribacteria bacterium]
MNKAKVMISMSEEFLSEIDEIAKEEKRSRSDLLREAINLYLKGRKKQEIPFGNPRVKNAIIIQDALANQDSLKEWNSTAEIRRWREKR